MISSVDVSTLLATTQHARRPGRVDPVDERDLGIVGMQRQLGRDVAFLECALELGHVECRWLVLDVLIAGGFLARCLHTGRMFWLTRKKFPGSYLALICASLA